MYTRDESYYFTLITIRVQDCLFRVPRHVFEEHSEVFRNMFSMPVSSFSEGEMEGESDENPIQLDGVNKQSFKDFLAVLYPPPRGADSRKPSVKHPASPSDDTHISSWRLEKWLSILRLAHMWEFPSVRELAISNINRLGLNEVQRIELTHKYDIDEWYLPAYKALAKRRTPLTIEEAVRLGLDTVTKMAKVRERWLTLSSSSRMRQTRPKSILVNEVQMDPDEAELEACIVETFELRPSQIYSQKTRKRPRNSI